jgi:hypothetical protein
MKFFITNGIISKGSDLKKPGIGRTDLVHIVKQIFSRLNVQFIDECCDSNSQYTTTRYDITNSVMQFFNPETKEWENVA